MMEETRLLLPFFGVLVLTFCVWVFMYVRRIGYMVANKIPAHAGSTPQKMNQVLPDAVNNSANNFRNLFELPVLFYVVCLYLLWAGLVDQVHIVCAYVFFVSRAVHSVIHCTINHVMSRFVSYVCGAIALWVMLIRAVLSL